MPRHRTQYVYQRTYQRATAAKIDCMNSSRRAPGGYVAVSSQAKNGELGRDVPIPIYWKNALHGRRASKPRIYGKNSNRRPRIFSFFKIYKSCTLSTQYLVSFQLPKPPIRSLRFTALYLSPIVLLKIPAELTTSAKRPRTHQSKTLNIFCTLWPGVRRTTRILSFNAIAGHM